MCRRVFVSGLLALSMTLPVAAQHLNLDPVDTGVGLDVADVTLDPSEALLSDVNGTEVISVVDRSRTQFENWLIVTALGVCFTFGLVVTVGTMRRGSATVPTSIF